MGVEKIIIKPSVEIKMAAAPEPVISRRKKKEPEPEEAGSLFDDLPQVKPKVKDEFAEREKKAKEEEKIIIKPAILPTKVDSESSESEGEEDVKPEPKKKLSVADLKPSVQIKVAAAPEPAVARRKKKEVVEEEQPMFDDAPKAKPKVRDIYAERRKKQEEEEKIVITPAVLPEKPAEEPEPEPEDGPKAKDKVRDEFAERERKTKEEQKIIITPAVLPEKAKEEEEEESPDQPKKKGKVSDQFPEKKKKEKKDAKVVIKPKDLPKKKGARVRFSDQPGVVRRKKQEPPVDEEASKEDMFKDIPPVDKKKVSDEFPEKEKKAKEEEKIVIKPADLSGRGKKPIAEEEQIVMEDVVDVEQVPEDETDARAAKDKVRDHFPEKERKKAEEEKIVITPAALVEQTPPEEPEKPKKIKQDNKITPRTPPQRRRGPREDHSMIKLGKMLGETGGLDDENFDQVKGKYRPRDPREVRDERISPGPRRKFSGDDKDIKVQQQVSVMIQKANVRCDAKSFHHHTEHVVMIKLGRLQNAGNLTFEKYNKMKSSHRIEMSERVRFREIDSYDHEHDVFARLDNVVTNHPITIKFTTSGAKPKVQE